MEEIVNMNNDKDKIGKKKLHEEGPLVVRGELVRAGGIIIIIYVLYKNIYI